MVLGPEIPALGKLTWEDCHWFEARLHNTVYIISKQTTKQVRHGGTDQQSQHSGGGSSKVRSFKASLGYLGPCYKTNQDASSLFSHRTQSKLTQWSLSPLCKSGKLLLSKTKIKQKKNEPSKWFSSILLTWLPIACLSCCSKECTFEANHPPPLVPTNTLRFSGTLSVDLSWNYTLCHPSLKATWGTFRAPGFTDVCQSYRKSAQFIAGQIQYSGLWECSLKRREKQVKPKTGMIQWHLLMKHFPENVSTLSKGDR